LITAFPAQDTSVRAVDEIRDTADPAHVAGPQELRDLLAGEGIPVHLWGTGLTKRVDDLWSEIGRGEAALTTGSPPQRLVTCVRLVVRRGGKRLTEVAQQLANGEVRERRSPPAEKLLPGEDAEAAAFRCVEEELGVPRAVCRIFPGTHTEKTDASDSPSYPGLATRYLVHELEIEVPDLPATEFSTPEADGSGDSTIRTHYWGWA
jgi:hypothetical protein